MASTRGHWRILDRLRTLAREAGAKRSSSLLTRTRGWSCGDYRDFFLLNTLEEKLELLRAEGIDTTVVVLFSKEFAAKTAAEYVEEFLVKKFRPHTIVIGYDHRFGHDRAGGIDFLLKNKEKHGFRL